jgi:hypothetical protein
VRHTAIIATLVLAACSGGGDNPGAGNVVSPVPAPTPAPSPSPSPTPSPTPTYLTYDALTGDQSFPSTDCVATVGAFGSQNIEYTAASQTYSVYGGDVKFYQVTFGPADVDTTVPDAVRAYARANPKGGTDRFVIRRPAVAGVPLDYVRLAEISVIRPTLSVREGGFCTFGVQTLPTDLLTVGAQLFNLSLTGTVTLTGSSDTYTPFAQHDDNNRRLQDPHRRAQGPVHRDPFVWPGRHPRGGR